MNASTPPHLGGHCGITHTDRGALAWFWNTLGCRTMLDLGCGPGGQVQVARDMGYEAKGVDGDPTVEPDHLIDFTKQRVIGHWTWARDLIWCVEFVEHVEARYIPNFLPSLTAGRFVVLTHGLPGSEGAHHHVNCQPPIYWEGVMNGAGYVVSAELTATLKEKSTMERNFIEQTGRVFVPA